MRNNWKEESTCVDDKANDCTRLPSGNKMSLSLNESLSCFAGRVVHESSGLGSGLGRFYDLPAGRH